MKYPEGTPENLLSRTAGKYGGSLLFEIFNFLCVGTAVNYIIILAVYIFTGNNGIDISTDFGYGFMMLMNDICSYAAPALLFFLIFRNDLKETRYIAPYPKVRGELILLYFAGGCLADWGGVTTNIVSQFLNNLFNVPEPEVAFSSTSPQNAAQYIIFAVFVVFTGPILEELIYRHLLLRPMRKFGDLTAAIISSLIFALSHFNFDQFLYTFLFGFSLSIVAIRRNSVVPTIIMHIINNAIATIVTYMPESLGNKQADAVFSVICTILNYSGFFVLFGGIAAVIAAALLHLFEFRKPDILPVSAQLKVLFTSPLVIAGIVCSLVLTFYLLYV